MTTRHLKRVVALTACLFTIQIASVDTQTGECRNKHGVLNRTDFNIKSCSWCYYYLFQNKPLSPSRFDIYLTVINNLTSFPAGTKLISDYTNETSVSHICSTLSQDECHMWLLCCQSASDCCTRQLQTTSEVNTTKCQKTWDGFGCWDDTLPGTTSHLVCPSFIKYSVPTRSAIKTCQSDGTWLRKGVNEWTDYTPCLKFQSYRDGKLITGGGTPRETYVHFFRHRVHPGRTIDLPQASWKASSLEKFEVPRKLKLKKQFKASQ